MEDGSWGQLVLVLVLALGGMDDGLLLGVELDADGVGGVLLHELLAFLHLLAFLGAPVLEPNLHLAFGKAQVGRQLGFPPDGYVTAVVELLFEFHTLMVAVHHAVLVFRSRLTWNNKRTGAGHQKTSENVRN